jgi:hypothetical protein
MTLPTDAAARKALPLATGVLDYFPDALAEVARCSQAGNDQHNPGQPLHWDRSKSGDEADALVRHLIQRGTVDSDGIRHSAKVAWRALALLQKELEAAGAPMARGARVGSGSLDDLRIERGMFSGQQYIVGRGDREASAPVPLGVIRPNVPIEPSYLDSFGPNAVRQDTGD